MEQLYNLKRVESMSNVHDLRKLYDKVELFFRNLNSPEISSETYGAFLVPLLTGKFTGIVAIVCCSENDFRDLEFD